MGMRLLVVCWLALVLLVDVGCTSHTKRIAPDEISDIEVGTGLTSQDFRSIAQRMARSLVVLPQIQNAAEPPKVAFVNVANNSHDYIDGASFLRKMRTELLKHADGRIVFLDRDVIGQIERENRDKERGQRTATGAQTPLGADFFLTGDIESIWKATESGRTSYMRYSFRLTDAGSSAIVWEDDYEIKKVVKSGTIYQ